MLLDESVDSETGPSATQSTLRFTCRRRRTQSAPGRASSPRAARISSSSTLRRPPSGRRGRSCWTLRAAAAGPPPLAETRCCPRRLRRREGAGAAGGEGEGAGTRRGRGRGMRGLRLWRDSNSRCVSCDCAQLTEGTGTRFAQMVGLRSAATPSTTAPAHLCNLPQSVALQALRHALRFPSAECAFRAFGALLALALSSFLSPLCAFPPLNFSLPPIFCFSLD